MTTALAPLAALTEAELAAEYERAASDYDALAPVLAEIDRRDREERRRQLRRMADPLRDEWIDAAHAQYLAAERECKGVLVRGVSHDYREDPETPGACSDCGRASGHVTHSGVSPFALWSGSEAFAQRWASEELLEYWQAHPRVTIGDYRNQARHQAEVYRDELVRDAPGGVRPDAARVHAASAASPSWRPRGRRCSRTCCRR